MSKPILIFLMLASAIFSEYSYASSFEGCYSRTDKITSATPMLNEDGSESNERFKLKTSYINVFKEDDKYFTEGLIWGFNFHICTITAPVEGVSAPLPLVLKGKKLVFEEQEPEYDINCKFELEFDESGLHIKDKNYHCSNYMFYCGAHASVHDVHLVKNNKGCN
ncbi:MAG: hypothetical protein ACI6PR_06685 [Pseudoalteromonas sp.]|uniref:hypothetical protein n=1 Tax=Pseudoalteromonas sp. TaxID=53249 RepID=UPI00384C562C